MRMGDTGIPQPDYPTITQDIVEFLDSCLTKTGSGGFVMGMSGGVDSAVLAHLACIRHRDRTLAVIMPDTGVTPDSETDDGTLMADALGLERKTVVIDDIMAKYAGVLGQDRRALGNLRARVRSAILYYHANAENRMVLGSTDRSEHLLGYYTKFGDGASDITPIISLYKTQVRGLASHLGVPDRVISKRSSPHLWDGHDAEEEIGAPYRVVDQILYQVYDAGATPAECSERTGIPQRTVLKIQKMVTASRHKREAPYSPGPGER